MVSYNTPSSFSPFKLPYMEMKGRGRRRERKEERGAREEYMHVTEKMLKLTAYQADPRLSVWECTSALPGREEIEISVVIRAACDV